MRNKCRQVYVQVFRVTDSISQLEYIYLKQHMLG